MSSTSHGEALEKRAFSYFTAEIKAGRFFAKPECCAVFLQRPYFSRDRRSEIIFDLAIEVSLPGAAAPSVLCLIECKHLSHPIGVQEVEEFFAKVQQVAAAGLKAIMVTTSSFQRSAIEFARSKRIGLLRLFSQSNFKYELYRSPSTSLSAAFSNHKDIWCGLTQELYESRRYDCYCCFGDLLTYALNDFFRALTMETLDASRLEAVAAEQSDTPCATFLSRDEIEARCRTVLSIIGYKGGMVSLRAVCDWQERETGLQCEMRRPEKGEAARGILGRITFDPPSIVVFFDAAGEARQRFTLAHELGHLLLGHGSYLKAESADAADLESYDAELSTDDLRHLEWQASYFASCLLLPREALIACAFIQAHNMGLSDRGHGLLFVDSQPCNLENYQVFTTALMNGFGVSRTAVTIRLRELGLLKDYRTGDLAPRRLSKLGDQFSLFAGGSSGARVSKTLNRI